ncbi:MAG: extracellular solute-binding protein [Chloroflexi bacterium]|nr:extracellular solute-binding protein [Chloroflexota bacterium]
MKKLQSSVMFLALSGLILVACGQVAGPSVTTQSKPPAAATNAPSPRADWEQKWETALAGGKKEGSVRMYTSGWPPELRVALTRAFKDKHGIDLEFTPVTRGEEIITRVEAENRANLQLVDVFGAGTTTLLGVGMLKQKGLLGPVEPFLMLTEVLDPKAWSGEKFPFVDKDRLVVGMSISVGRYLLYNTESIREGEITAFKDVLKPQYRGKITLNDPTVSGPGQAFINHLILDLWNFEEVNEFLKRLIKQQEAVILRDNRILVESVARGKFSIGLAPHQPTAAEFINLGAPIKFVVGKEGTFASYGSGNIGVPARPAHPAATRVFINWLLSREGQTIFSRQFGLPSIRPDVPTDGFLPVYLQQPGERLFWLTEERISLMDDWLRMSKKVIEDAAK